MKIHPNHQKPLRKPSVQCMKYWSVDGRLKLIIKTLLGDFFCIRLRKPWLSKNGTQWWRCYVHQPWNKWCHFPEIMHLFQVIELIKFAIICVQGPGQNVACYQCNINTSINHGIVLTKLHRLCVAIYLVLANTSNVSLLPKTLNYVWIWRACPSNCDLVWLRGIST